MPETPSTSDPNHLSGTDERALLARKRIPQYVLQLQSRLDELDAESIRRLYGEYRAYHRNCRTYPQHIERANPTYTAQFDSWTTTQLLDLLKDPGMPSREQALNALCYLRAEVTVPANGRPHALT